MKTRNIQITILTIVAIFVFSDGLLYAQEGPGRMQRFREEKIKYFNEKLELTDAEAKEFWPVYEDMHNRMMKIMDDEQNLLNYYNSNSAAMSEEEVKVSIKEYFALQEQRTELVKEYHDKYVKILGEKKTMKVYSLEHEFRRYILDQFRQGRNGNGGGGQGRYRGGNR